MHTSRYRSWMSRINTRIIHVTLLQVMQIILSLPGIPLQHSNAQQFAVAARQQAERYCDTNSDCNTEHGERCRVYDGCSKGLCVCEPTEDTRPPYCTASKCGQSCPDTMACTRGRCRCLQGTPTADGLFCKNTNYKLLGEECSPDTDTCFHKTDVGYLSTAVMCSSSGRCRCNKGYKESRLTCRKMGIGETGCLEAYQCDSGAICQDGRCQCPPGYKVFQKSKCVKNEAVLNLPLGAQCDEINGKRYCMGSMQCYRCPSSHRDRCVNLVKVYPTSAAAGPVCSSLVLITSLLASAFVSS